MESLQAQLEYKLHLFNSLSYNIFDNSELVIFAHPNTCKKLIQEISPTYSYAKIYSNNNEKIINTYKGIKVVKSTDIEENLFLIGLNIKK